MPKRLTEQHGMGGSWEKVLWRIQDYPDNYVDSKFLESLVVNAHVETRNYWSVVGGAVLVASQLCLVSLVGSVGFHLHQVGNQRAPETCVHVYLRIFLIVKCRYRNVETWSRNHCLCTMCRGRYRQWMCCCGRAVPFFWDCVVMCM